jgi:cell division protein ZapE
MPDTATIASPIAAYRARLESGQLKTDPAQALAAETLELLFQRLVRYRPPENGWLSRLGFGAKPEPAPRGLYLFGPVGRGKSMLMDMFHAAASVAKRRVHFHAFMLEVHEALHARRQKPAHEREGDAIAPLADRIAGAARLLCFDEFQITNIADAMILGRLLEALFARGVVIVATSNTMPDLLYEGGLQRELFLPTIALIKERMDVLDLGRGQDYRRDRLQGLPLYHVPLGPKASAALDEAFLRLTDGKKGHETTLVAQGRTLVIHKAARGVAMSEFDALCRKPLWSADYLAIATHFHTLILDDIPILRADERNEARRLITLIDALYEHRAKLICAAAAPPDEIYASGDHAGEFQRTASRLIEMQSAAYMALEHLT